MVLFCVGLGVGFALGLVLGFNRRARDVAEAMTQGIAIGRDQGLREARNEAMVMARFGVAVPVAQD